MRFLGAGLPICGAALLVLTTTGCVGDSYPPPVDLEPAEYFRLLEQRLLDARSISIESLITSKGAVKARLEGHLKMKEGNVVDLQHSGSFLGLAVDLRIDSDGARMQGGSRSGTFDTDTPAALNEAIVIGITRMGLLHNLARLAVGGAPEHTDGTIREWVQATELDAGEVEKHETVSVRPLTFAVVVDGRRTAEGTLYVNIETGLPLRREQKVLFGEVAMNVTEIYRTFAVE